jgi:hypothetical protein
MMIDLDVIQSMKMIDLDVIQDCQKSISTKSNRDKILSRVELLIELYEKLNKELDKDLQPLHKYLPKFDWFSADIRDIYCNCDNQEHICSWISSSCK